ncbi:MAG: ImmA/IrrE family metallo-endopeptidase [Candidatus Hodarchaeota archaeon]
MTPQAEATSLLEEVGIRQLPVIPEEICRRLGIHCREDQYKDLDGILVLDPKTGIGIISVNSSVAEQGRKNFTIAHELGHWCMDSFEQNAFFCPRGVIESFKSTIKPMELRANEFASEFLMPQFLYQPLVDARLPDWNEIKELAELSQTTLTATAIRFIDLTDEACCLIVSQEGKIAWFRKSNEFRPYVQMGNRLLSTGTVAYSIFKGDMPPDGFEGVEAENWLSGRGVKAYTEILEWSLPLNFYGQVLTLLYDEEGIAGWDEDDEDEEADIEWEPPTFHKSKRKK